MGRRFLFTWIALVVVGLGTPVSAQVTDYDLVIRNGRVLDGNGNPWIRADVAIKDGRFARIGKVEGHGRREIDASGKYVSPGWIDMLDQSGETLLQNGLAESKLRMGVTTGISGEGGTVVAAEKLPDYFAQLEKSGISMNFGTYYNEAQARVEVLQYAARAPTAEELARMQGILETAMKNGPWA
jgi:N-acyl-D-aspartate/D-glutamate deacylase